MTLAHGVRGIIEPGGRQPVARGGAAKQRNPGICKKLTRTPNVVRGWQNAWLKKLQRLLSPIPWVPVRFLWEQALRVLSHACTCLTSVAPRGSKFRSASTPPKPTICYAIMQNVTSKSETDPVFKHRMQNAKRRIMNSRATLTVHPGISENTKFRFCRAGEACGIMSPRMWAKDSRPG